MVAGQVVASFLPKKRGDSKPSCLPRATPKIPKKNQDLNQLVVIETTSWLSFQKSLKPPRLRWNHQLVEATYTIPWAKKIIMYIPKNHTAISSFQGTWWKPNSPRGKVVNRNSFLYLEPPMKKNRAPLFGGSSPVKFKNWVIKVPFQ